MSVRKPSKILVTGGAGFIGSAFIHRLLEDSDFTGEIVNLDLLTYAGNLDNLKGLENHPRYRFLQGDIRDQDFVSNLLDQFEIDTIVHFAAESHVDRSIHSPRSFFSTNVDGTLSLLENVRERSYIHFHHISTDEVYGSLGEEGTFSERSPHRPNSPYAASKAASDHVVRAYANTYHLSVTISHCSNNYGPRQYPEKFIPMIITHCLQKKPIPVYGRGVQSRDWLFVDDHVDAIWAILTKGKSGQTYDIGADAVYKNIDLVQLIIELFAQEMQKDAKQYLSLIKFVKDRPGHDYRYAIDSTKAQSELDWQKKVEIQTGLRKTIRWYLKHSKWIADLRKKTVRS